ncbi:MULTISPECIES: hypothetical protein [unclassified Rhizobium]|uniref:hypothetical protein n=1 Tax=unclassified Rhizobium TaxID=2613769 RepID=UPI003818F0C5
MATCSVEACDRKAKKLGYCGKHYQRLRKHGDATKVLHPWGEAQKFFLETVLHHTGDDCLIWPFSRNEAGYAQIFYRGNMQIASRAVCIEVNGEPPSEKHHAAHSCGCGSDGCVAPNHLSWKTPADNQADRIVHGTSNRGERSASAKLSEDQVHDIRKRLNSGESGQELAEVFGVSDAAIYDIGNRRSWAHLEDRT